MKFKPTIKVIRLEFVLLLVFVFEFAFPHFAVAQTVSATSIMLESRFYIKAQTSSSFHASAVDTAQPEGKIALTVPIKEFRVKKTYSMFVTAYSSTIDQTDSDPCSTANGFNLCEHNQEDVVAANFLPFGTKIRIPEYFGDHVFTVQDRMNSRYTYQVDVWMKTRDAAKQFGAAYTKIVVLE